MTENQETGSPQSEWDVDGVGDGSIQGFATDISVNKGETVHFKIDTDADAYHIDIYRLGYYSGDGARLAGTGVITAATLPQIQPSCVYDGSLGLTDCGNWEESAYWDVPTDAVSGVYIAKLTRDDTHGASHIVFVVRDDASHSDIIMQTSDGTWHAYNSYGGSSLYDGPPAGRAYKVSYNRPFITRNADRKADFLFNADYPLIRWMEANGYDVTYSTCVDSDRRGALIQQHKIYISVGHDEYWSAGMRTNVEAARDAGVNLAFFSGNEVFWKTRFENSIDGTDTPYRTMTCYKETHAGAKIDPLPNVWTGTWRDPRFSPPADGGRPENALTGTIFTVNGYRNDNMIVTGEYRTMRFWRNSAVAGLAPAGSIDFGPGTLGFEWDEDLDNGARPQGLIHLSTTTHDVSGSYLLDYGSSYGAGIATHHLTMYRAPNGARVFGAGTVQWAWGLDQIHDTYYGGMSSGPPVQPAMQQATMNLFADMGNVQPATPMPGMVPTPGTSDGSPPVSTITFPASGDHVQSGAPVTITGTSMDAGGGAVAGVEVSVDGGTTWRRATGRESWTYDWSPAVLGAATIRVRGIDDSVNIESPGTALSVTVDTRTCPCTIWSPSAAPALTETDTNPWELGVRFTSDVDGFITALRYYKSVGLPAGTRIGHLWSSAGTMLAEATFTETASGWQEVMLPTPVAIMANTVYVASYHNDVGLFAVSRPYFNLSDYDSTPLHALKDNGVGNGNGVFVAGGIAFPTQTYMSSNYWVDVVFTPSLFDPDPPIVTAKAPANGATGVDAATMVTAMFNEGVQPATITFELRNALNALVPAAVGYVANTRTVTLDPTADLSPMSTYTATLSGAADIAGNVMAAVSWSFTTGASPCFVDRIEADFAQGATSGTAVSSLGDGAVTLAETTFADTFTQADGAAFNWEPTRPSDLTTTIPSWHVSGGVYVHDLNASPGGVDSTNYHPALLSSALTPTGDFSLTTRQRITEIGATTDDLGALGFVLGGVDFENFFLVQWIPPPCECSGLRVKLARTTPHDYPTLLSNLTIAPPATGQWYTMRIDVSGTHIDVYIDGVLQLSGTMPGYVPGRVGLLTYEGSASEYDDVTVVSRSNYPASGTFTSRVYSAGSPVSWQSASWTADQPAGTTLGISFRTGDTPVPDASWSAFAPIAASGDPIGVTAQYLQYRADLGTSSAVVTPALRDISFTCVQGPDETAPFVVSRTPSPGATDVATNTAVTVQFSEPMNAATLTTSTLRLRAAGALADVPATVSCAGAGATLAPMASLAQNVQYTVTLEGSVADLAGNPLGSTQTWTFTTVAAVAAPCFVDDTTADFQQGTLTSTYLTRFDDGEVSLAPTLGSQFDGTSLPAGWEYVGWPQTPAGTVAVSGGTLAVDGGRANTDTLGFYGPGRSMEFVATFGAVGWQHAGLGTTFNEIAPNCHSAKFTTWDGTAFFANSEEGSTQLFTPLSNSLIGGPHRYRIEWGATTITYYVDGALVATHTLTIGGVMRPIFSDYETGGPTLRTDWVHLSPYTSSGTYLSRVYAAGGPVDWASASWTADTPIGTSLVMSVRTGGTPILDGSWGAWVPIGSSGGPIGATAQYAQYRAEMTSSDPEKTTLLRDVSLVCAAGPDQTPPAIAGRSPAPGATGVALNATVTVFFSEPMNPATLGTTSLHLRESGAPADVPATVTYTGQTATLTPSSPLVLAGQYDVTVDGTVADLAGNPLGAAQVWSFHTITSGTLFQTTVADFNQGMSTGTQVVPLGDGAVTLASGGSFSDGFTQADGPATNWEPLRPTDGTATVPTWHVTSGVYVHDLNASPGGVDGTNYHPALLTNALTPPGDFSITSIQRITQVGNLAAGDIGVLGFVLGETDFEHYFLVQWIPGPCSCRGLRVKLMRTSPRNYPTVLSNLTIADPVLGQWYTLRMDVTGTLISIYIDNVLVLSGNMNQASLPEGGSSTYVPGRIGLLSYEGSANEYDDVTVAGGSTYVSSGTHTSNVLDAGRVVNWVDLMATGSRPPGTDYTFETRSASDPGGPWEAWRPLSGMTIASSDSRYLQYRATLTTTDSGVTPELQRVDITYETCVPEICNGLDDDCDGQVDEDITATMAIPSDLTGIPSQPSAVVPILLSDVTGKEAYSAEMDLRFAPGVLAAPSVAQGAGLAGKNCDLLVSPISAGRILIAVYCTAPLTDGSLVDVSFQVANVLYGATSELTLAGAQLNEGCPVVSVSNGLFTVQGPEICDGQDNDGNLLVDEICTVSGTVIYYRTDVPEGEPSAKPVRNVEVAASGLVPGQVTTGLDGTYLIGGLRGAVTVAPLSKYGTPRASDHNGAISSMDASAAARAAVGKELLSGNQVFAGDVTGNHAVSALDASYIARFSVELVGHFPVAITEGSDWKFLKCESNYPDDCGTPSYTIDPNTGPLTAKNFYAILYGEVTGNWAGVGTFAADRAAISSEENDALSRDRELADRFRREGAPPVVERRPGMGAAELSLLGWKPLRAGERAQLTVDLSNADGILGLDLVLRYDPSRLAIVDVTAVGIGSALSVARGDRNGTQRIAAYGYAALSGSGSILTITVEGLGNKGPQLPPTIGGVANEGGIPLRVRERGQTPPMRR